MKSGQRLIHFDSRLLNILDTGSERPSIECLKKSLKRVGVTLRQHFYTPILEITCVTAHVARLCFSLGKPAESNALNATRDEQHVSLHSVSLLDCCRRYGRVALALKRSSGPPCLYSAVIIPRNGSHAPSHRESVSTALRPPKAKESEMAWRIAFSRAVFGTTSRGHSGSGPR